MKYLYMQDNKVFNIISEYDPNFPKIPIQERYSHEFLSKCIVVADNLEVEQNWDYLAVTTEFKPPIEYLGSKSIESNVGEECSITAKFSVSGEINYEADSGITVSYDKQTNLLNARADKVGIYLVKLTLIAIDSRITYETIYVEVKEIDSNL